MLIRTAILRAILLWFTISCFTLSYFMLSCFMENSVKPLYAYVVEENGGLESRTDKILLSREGLKPVSQLMDVEVMVELEPNSLNEEGKIEPASRILYLISIFNGGVVTVFDALLVAKVPQNTLFIVEESDARWNAARLMNSAQKSPDRSCPDRHPPGLECTIELSDLGPDERVTTIRYVVEVDGLIAMNIETIDLNIELFGSLIDNGPLDVNERVANNTVLADPTALFVAEEPLMVFHAGKERVYADLQRPELDLPVPPRQYYIYIPWVAAQRR